MCSTRLKNIGLLIFLIGIVLGCKQMEHMVRPTDLKSSDGKFQITVPAGWRENKTLHEDASIGAANTSKEVYVIVISENKSDFASDIDLDKFTEVTRTSMTSKLKSPEATPATPVKINGKTGRQYMLQGEGKLVKVAYLVTTVETAEQYHQIIAWTLKSRIDQNQPVLQQVTESFREATAKKD